jgi:thiol-disulfide isomerase/thioredoxin
MKFLLVLVSLLLCANHATSQAGDRQKAVKALQRLSAKLNSLASVQYRYEREILYAGEDYHNTMKGDVFIQFEHASSAFRFQGKNERGVSVYNGKHYFYLDENTRTISIDMNPGPNSLESISYLYNSLLTVKNVARWLIQNDSLIKTVRDTMVNGQAHTMISFQLYNAYLSSLGQVRAFEKEYVGDLQRPYQLIINSATSLPYQYISKFGGKGREKDFVAATFLDIVTDAAPPAENSWYYSTYTSTYKPPAAKKPLIATGALMGNWSLPSLAGDSVTLSSLSGKPVLIEFWIKNCGYCMLAFDKMSALSNKYPASKLGIVSINTEDPKEAVAFFKNKHQVKYPMLYDGGGIADLYGVTYYPTVLLLDATGRVAYSGSFDEKIIEEELRKLLR